MRRRRLDAESAKEGILGAAEELMKLKGYGAVNTRTVALHAGIKPNTVHYHFGTTENLLMAVFKRVSSRSNDMLAEALASERPMEALWQFNVDEKRETLAIEFMAMASRLPLLQQEMAHRVEHNRKLQAKLLEKAIGKCEVFEGVDPTVAALMISAIARALIMERRIGIDLGHAELDALVRGFLKKFDQQD
jgi:AcrR family transcriptional regulator